MNHGGREKILCRPFAINQMQEVCSEEVGTWLEAHTLGVDEVSILALSALPSKNEWAASSYVDAGGHVHTDCLWEWAAWEGITKDRFWIEVEPFHWSAMDTAEIRRIMLKNGYKT